jgi:hypothetical protein
LNRFSLIKERQKSFNYMFIIAKKKLSKQESGERGENPGRGGCFQTVFRKQPGGGMDAAPQQGPEYEVF